MASENGHASAGELANAVAAINVNRVSRPNFAPLSFLCFIFWGYLLFYQVSVYHCIRAYFAGIIG